MKKLGHTFGRVSGITKDDCQWIGYRFDAEYGWHPHEGECWLVQTRGEWCNTYFAQVGWLTDIWRTESRVWVSDAYGIVLMNPSFEAQKEEWQTFTLGGSIMGVWGLHDEFMFAWGSRDNDPVAFHYNGSGWHEVSAPGIIHQVCGVRNDLIYAVGMNGLIARWDGNAFQAIHGPAEDHLVDVFVASAEEIYACSNSGHLLRGSVHGWDVLLKYEGSLCCVTKWQNNVWVGAGKDGLFRLEERELELIKPNVHAERFDARDRLLILAPDMIVDTEDGVAFEAVFLKSFEDLTMNTSPLW